MEARILCSIFEWKTALAVFGCLKQVAPSEKHAGVIRLAAFLVRARIVGSPLERSRLF